MLKNVLVGLGTALAGFVATLIAGMFWTFMTATKNPPGSQEETTAVFSPLGFIHHFWWFWWLVALVGAAGFLYSYWRTRAVH